MTNPQEQYGLHILYTILTLVVYTTVLGTYLKRYASKLCHEKVPLTIPKLCLFWAVSTFLTTILVNLRYNTIPATATKRNWFSAGWADNFYFFSIPIDTWYKYTIIIMYQITRSMFGSLVNNVFKPFLLVEVQNKLLNKHLFDDNDDKVLKKENSRRRNEILFAQVAVSLYAYWSQLTDLFLFLSQVDISSIALAITLICDGALTFSLLEFGLVESIKNVADVAKTFVNSATNLKV